MERGFVERIRSAVADGRISPPVTVVLEGAARAGAETGGGGGVTVLHAPGSGDEALVGAIGKDGRGVTLVTADRELRRRAEALGANVVGPGWLLDLLS